MTPFSSEEAFLATPVTSWPRSRASRAIVAPIVGAFYKRLSGG